MPAFVEVLVDVASVGTDRPFHYRVPEVLREACRPGARIVVPFGTREVEAVVLRRLDAPAVADTRDVSGLAGAPPVEPDLLALAEWLAERYACLTVQALRAILPTGTRRASAQTVRPRAVAAVRPAVTRAELLAAAGGLRRRAPRQAAALEAAARLWPAGPAGEPGEKPPGEAAPTWPVSAVAESAGVGRAAVRALVARGLLEPARLEVWRDPYRDRPVPPEAVFEPTSAQARAVDAIVAALPGYPPQAGPGGAPAGARSFLLYGVPASGKTEVYLRAIAAAVNRGLSAICLVPEIALTPQMTDAFRSRFGAQVAVLHSGLGMGERFDAWRRARSGLVRVVVGARSAVFAPLDDLGLIIVDEEHEPSYKQAEDPKYHAREVALERARRRGAAVVLGSATPSLETAYRTVRGEFVRLNLPDRVASGLRAPAVEVVDLREEQAADGRSIFSRPLKEALSETLSRGGQAILFLNRRGHSTFVLCRDCGHALRCPHCDVSLVYHAAGRQVRCHYCDLRRRAPETCPACGGHRIRYFGLGTQRVEESMRNEFPGVRAVRMDADTTRKKGAHAAILDAFGRREADVLVGTQMIAKGLHLPGVVLVGVLAADTTLNLPDFRAAERTFQLLTQVAGRAGRGEDAGRAIIQTYAPDHYAVQAAAAGDYPGFYRQEMAARRAARYPPFVHLASFLTHAPDEGAARRAAEDVAGFIRDLTGSGDGGAGAGDTGGAARGGGAPAGPRERPLLPGLELLGPAPAPLARIQGRWRWQCLLKAADAAEAARIARQVHARYNTGGRPWSRTTPARAGTPPAGERSIRLVVDVDPADLL